MNYVPVDSSNIAAIGYDAALKTLGVRFHAGTEYEYLSVPASIFDGLLAAPSAGRYFDQNVRKAGYAFRRVR